MTFAENAGMLIGMVFIGIAVFGACMDRRRPR